MHTHTHTNAIIMLNYILLIITSHTRMHRLTHTYTHIHTRTRYNHAQLHSSHHHISLQTSSLLPNTSGLIVPTVKQRQTSSRRQPSVMGSWEENVTLQCDLVHSILVNESAMCKSGAFSNDQWGNNCKIVREATARD